jgi:ubiquinone/menaquinone biosynthesis C-methylase UbiE
MAIEKSNSPGEFIDFERAGWDANIAGYEDFLGPVSRQTVGPTLDAAAVRSGMRVLDVCTGPGMLAAGAIARGAQATGIDFSGEVVELARNLVPQADMRQGDAQRLPFPDNSFDAVVCGYGVMHIPEPEQALREMVRVVRPGGRVAISVWDSSAPNNGFSLVYAGIRAHGTMNVPLPHGADFFQFSTEEKMRAALADISLGQLETKRVDQRWNVKSASAYMEAIRGGTVRAGAVLKGQSEAATVKILGFFEQTLAGMANPAGGFDIPLPALVGSGAK